MHIKMDNRRRGTEDGFTVLSYSKGVVYYDVPARIALRFISDGDAHEASLAEMDAQINRVQ